MIAFPNCKINLGLHILRKRSDGFHDLETAFYPIPLQDGLELIQGPGKTGVTLSVTGLQLDAGDNICVKAWQLLKSDFPTLPALRMHLHKVIPAGAGLGGGSSDGAFALMLLNRKFNLGLTESQLRAYALRLGSDCPFFIVNKPCLAKGRGEKLEPMALDLSDYKIAIINPGIHVPTAEAFAHVTPFDQRQSLTEIIRMPVAQWKGLLVNDFEQTVFKKYPEIARIKDCLYQDGAVYASMSGSGSTVYALFPKQAPVSLSFPQHYFQRVL